MKLISQTIKRTNELTTSCSNHCTGKGIYPQLRMLLIASLPLIVFSPFALAENTTLHDFAAHATDLTKEHKDAIRNIATTITSDPPRCVRIIGHSAAWRNLSNQEYCSRSVERAENAATLLQDALEAKGKSVEIITEQQALLGNTEQCTGNSMVTTARCPTKLGADLILVVGGRSKTDPLVDNMIESSSKAARANRDKNRRVEIMPLGKSAGYQSCPAPMLATGETDSTTNGSKVKKKFNQMIKNLPNDRQRFVSNVVKIAQNEVNLPLLFKTFTSKNKEFKEPIKYKKISKFARTNFYTHLRPIEKTIESSGQGKPAWLTKIRKVMSQPNAHQIDPYLAMAIVLRESGKAAYPNCNSCKVVNTAAKGGLDSLYSIRRKLVKEGLIPKSFLKSIKKSSHSGFKNSVDIQQEYLAALTFAYVGHSRLTLIRAIGNVYYADESDKQARFALASNHLDSASPIAQRAWTQIALGREKYTHSFLRHMKTLNLPLDAIRDIPNGVSVIKNLTSEQKKSKRELKRRANPKQAKVYYNAIKIAVISEALQRSNETKCETDRRNYSVLLTDGT